MQDYKTADKTGWFIQQMKSGWLSRQEIVGIAAKEFPSTSVKKLDGTIGQYWSDCVNPKWGTYKAIHALGLRVVEDAGRRRIVEAIDASSPILNDRVSKRNVTIAHRPAAGGSFQMTDPLVNFDWASLYCRYDASCRRFDSHSVHLEAVRPAPENDRALYYWLVKTAAPDASELRQGANIGWYEALLYWKLYSQPAALHNLAEWLRTDAARRGRNTEQLSNLLAELPLTIHEEVPAVNALLKAIDKYRVDGMGVTALPVRTTFLHILYPAIVPIFDKMVRRAVGLPEDDQSMEVFRQYLPYAWELAHRHVENRKEFPENPVRLTDMALWIVRGNS